MAYLPKKLAQAFPTATTELTVYTSTAISTIVKQIFMANITGTQAVVSISLVPSGGSVADGNRLVKDLPIGANQPIVLDLDQVMDAGDFISVKVGTASSITFNISGVTF